MRITNIVCGANLNCRLDLEQIARKSIYVIYNPKKFNGLIWRHRKIPCTCLVFQSGKIVCPGIKQNSHIKSCVRKYARLIQTLGYDVNLTHVKFITSSAFHDLRRSVDYFNIVKYLNGLLEPEIFHAVTIKRGKVHFIVYKSGKVIITGIRSDHDIQNIVQPLLLELEFVI